MGEGARWRPPTDNLGESPALSRLGARTAMPGRAHLREGVSRSSSAPPLRLRPQVVIRISVYNLKVDRPAGRIGAAHGKDRRSSWRPEPQPAPCSPAEEIRRSSSCAGTPIGPLLVRLPAHRAPEGRRLPADRSGAGGRAIEPAICLRKPAAHPAYAEIEHRVAGPLTNSDTSPPTRSSSGASG